MADINGTVAFGIKPYGGTAMKEMNVDQDKPPLLSPSVPIKVQVVWTSGALTEATEPSSANFNTTTNKGDIVNAIFKVYTTTKLNPESQVGTAWKLSATIKKSRDIPNRHYDTDAAADGHRFTVDISKVLADELSYSLCPLNKGTYKSAPYGGMNGGKIPKDNVTQVVSDYNVTRNCAYRNVKVEVSFEIIHNLGVLIDATTTLSTNSDPFSVINSVFQFNRDRYAIEQGYQQEVFAMGSTRNPSQNRINRFMTNYPNWQGGTISNNGFRFQSYKSIRMDDYNEFLYMFIWAGSYFNTPAQRFAIEITPYDYSGASQGSFYLADFLDTMLFNGTDLENKQRGVFVQNISPQYCAFNAVDVSGASTSSTIDSDTDYYQVMLTNTAGGSTRSMSVANYYKIDRECNNDAFEYVRFHFLNRLGGIDSFTAKKDVVESLSISKDIIDRKSTDRRLIQAVRNDSFNTVAVDNAYINDTMRGLDTYKGGREVMNINADYTGSVYTDPLNMANAKWLEEMITSPNVWIERKSDAATFANIMNPQLRPAPKKEQLILNSDFSSSSNWTLGTGWSIAGGEAIHTGAASGLLTQTLTTNFKNGAYYRIEYEITQQNSSGHSPSLGSFGYASENLSVNRRVGKHVFIRQHGNSTLNEFRFNSNAWEGKLAYIRVYELADATEYMPVIITNSDIETVNEANNLVQFNIQYTHAHGVQTQRN